MISENSDFMQLNSTLTTAKWSLRRPTGWRVEQPDAGKTVLVGPKIGPFNAGVMVDELSGNEDDLVALMQRLADEQSELPHYRCLDETDLSTNDYQALAVRSTWYHTEADVMMLTQQVFCHYDGTLFVLTSVTPNSPDKQQLNSLLTQMLSSFRFSPTLQ